MTPADTAHLDRWAGALARLAEGPTEYGPHDVEALAAATERLVAENARLTAELAGLRTYLTRSIANDLGGMDEAGEILGNLPAQDRETVDAWAREMSDPTYWSKELAELRATLDNERAAWVDMRADVLQGGWTNGDPIEINDVLDKIDEYMPDACVAPAAKEPR